MASMTNSARETREQAKRLGWLTEAQAALGWGVILVLVALLGAIYLTQASRIAAVGRRIQLEQNELTTLKRENSALEQQISEIQSLDWLQQEAIRLGFVPAQPEEIEYIIVPNYPAATATPINIALTATPLAPPPATITEALWVSFGQSISGLMQGEAENN